MDTITIDGIDDTSIHIDPATIDPDILREAITRGLTEMFTERYEEAKLGLAQRVLADMSAEVQPFRKVA